MPAVRGLLDRRRGSRLGRSGRAVRCSTPTSRRDACACRPRPAPASGRSPASRSTTPRIDGPRRARSRSFPPTEFTSQLLDQLCARLHARRRACRTPSAPGSRRCSARSASSSTTAPIRRPSRGRPAVRARALERRDAPRRSPPKPAPRWRRSATTPRSRRRPTAWRSSISARRVSRSSGSGDGFLDRRDARSPPARWSTRRPRTPEHFSPNVLLRPLVQDTLFPTVAYVGGPSELVYLGQLKEVYEHFGLPMPLVYPRASATLVDSAAARFLTRYDVPLEVAAAARRSGAQPPARAAAAARGRRGARGRPARRSTQRMAAVLRPSSAGRRHARRRGASRRSAR